MEERVRTCFQMWSLPLWWCSRPLLNGLIQTWLRCPRSKELLHSQWKHPAKSWIDVQMEKIRMNYLKTCLICSQWIKRNKEVVLFKRRFKLLCTLSLRIFSRSRRLKYTESSENFKLRRSLFTYFARKSVRRRIARASQCVLINYHFGITPQRAPWSSAKKHRLMAFLAILLVSFPFVF